VKSHQPVLLGSVMDYLDVRPGNVYVDCTCGSGGHSREILERTRGKCFLICLDKDSSAVARAASNLAEFAGSFTLINDGFENLAEVVKRVGRFPVSGVLFDLGFSAEQISSGDRGFSFLYDGPLDMRFDKESHLTAGEILNRWPRQQLARIFSQYGEIPEAERIALEIVCRRKNKPFSSTMEFAEFIKDHVRSRRSFHPATLFFQALRIAVNDELENLKKGMNDALSVLDRGGRLVVISYHSLEDKIVKFFMRNTDGIKAMTAKPVTPDRVEVAVNPSARSAKLRAGERT